MQHIINIFGSSIACINQVDANNFFLSYGYEQRGYVCFPNTYVVTEATKDTLLRDILNRASLTLPDGKPLEFYARIKGYTSVRTVSGYWLCNSLLQGNLTHYFYGASPKTIAILEHKLRLEYPQAQLLGFKSPPMVGLAEIAYSSQIQQDIEEIKKLSPDIVWIGLSSPKQDYLMHYWHNNLDRGLMLGVGAVFNYLAGTEKKSPEWMKALGIRWLYRLLQDPRKHFVKYLTSNTVFILLCLKEMAGLRQKRLLTKAQE